MREAIGATARAAPGAAVVLAAVGSLLAAAPLSPAAAQETDRTPPPAAEGQAREGGGWLGVGLISFSECLEGPEAPVDECRHTLVVGGLVHGGPADRAGLTAGDTLVAVDGQPLAEGLEDGTFRRVTPGDTVSLLVGRPGGRVEVDVVPVSRPDSLAIVQYHGSGGHAGSRARYLLAIPEPAVLDSLRASTSRDADLAVPTRVSVVAAERVKEIPLGPEAGMSPAARSRERLAEMRARARQFQRRALRETRELRREMAGEMAEARRSERLVDEEWKRWVSEELQPRLQVIYDSVLAVARERMDSLRSVYPSMRARVSSEAMDSLHPGVPRPPVRESLRRARPQAPSRAPGADRPGRPPSPEELGMPGNRIAGAELKPLNPGLAEFFGGTERGLVVLQVLTGTPAHRIGLRPGDVIVEAGGHPVSSAEGLRHALMEHSPVEIRWLRRGRSLADTLRH